MAKHNVTGIEGEALAVLWLQQNGFVVLHRNWRHARYEVDAIAEKNGILHFIEVKTRRGKTFGEPEESVGTKKIMRVMKAAEAFQFQFPAVVKIQFDVLSISLNPDNKADYFFIEDVYV